MGKREKTENGGKRGEKTELSQMLFASSISELQAQCVCVCVCVLLLFLNFYTPTDSLLLFQSP